MLVSVDCWKDCAWMGGMVVLVVRPFAVECIVGRDLNRG